MEQPEGYEVEGDVVLKLRKSVYGLPNASKDWNKHIGNLLEGLNFDKLRSELCVFKRENLVLGVYVDDLLAIGTKEAIVKFKVELEKLLDVKELGEISRILNIDVDRDDKGFSLSQTNYIEEILDTFNMTECKPKYTVLPSDDDECSEAESFDKETYQSAIGSLLYLSSNTRPDISFAVGLLSRKCNNPDDHDWKKVKHLLRYLKATKSYRLYFNKNDDILKVYCDSDWGGDKLTRKSVNGFVVVMAGGACSWLSKKQNLIARSTMEAEYVCMSETSREIEWLSQFLKELNLEVNAPVIINCDNTAAIKFTVNDRISDRTKHIDIMFHKCKELVERNILKYVHVSTEENCADLFTKVLSREKTNKFCKMFGVHL